jgi:predicted CXXCH cytochrome family protein
MTSTLIVLALAGVLALWAAPAAAQPAGADNCATCHLAIGDDRLEKPAKDYPQDIHKAKGFGCVACHGGNEKEAGMEAMDPGKGYIGKPDRKQLVQVCGRCHSDAAFMKRYNPSLRVDQAAEYATSGHGRRLRESNDPKVAVCVSCHPAHSIRPPSDPSSSVHPLRVADTCGACHANAKYMEGRRLPTDQLPKYRESVHGKAMTVKGDLSAPTCNDCHGNHGASPPGVSWVGNVCGQCHTVMADLFGKSVHAKAFAEMGTPGCATCHENHAIRAPSDAMLGVGGDAVCGACHAATDNGGKTALEMRGLIDSLAARAEKARGVLEGAERAGMEVSQAQFDLNGARDALVKARAAVHAFRVDAVKREVEPGLAVSDKAHARGVRALEELRFRRQGLGVSLVIILAVMAGLVMKIRQVDRRRAPDADHHE